MQRLLWHHRLPWAHSWANVNYMNCRGRIKWKEISFQTNAYCENRYETQNTSMYNIFMQCQNWGSNGSLNTFNCHHSWNRTFHHLFLWEFFPCKTLNVSDYWEYEKAMNRHPIWDQLIFQLVWCRYLANCRKSGNRQQLTWVTELKEPGPVHFLASLFLNT